MPTRAANISTGETPANSGYMDWQANELHLIYSESMRAKGFSAVQDFELLRDFTHHNIVVKLIQWRKPENRPKRHSPGLAGQSERAVDRDS